ncbi:MAG: tetratricopeptide repeat protein [Candidatus Sulfotelmatobacter sp.]
MRLRLRFLPWNTVAHALLFFALTRLTAYSQSASTPETHGVAPTDSARLNLTAHVDFLGGLAREPMIVEHPDGTLFVSGYSGDRASGPPQTVPRLWKSTDRGSTWNAVNVGAEVDGAIGNSDVDLAVSRDGTLYFVTMGFDNKAFEGKHVAIGVSRDSGNTWHWTMLSKKRFDDRPWVAVEPNGAAHVIWNDGNGVYHTVSRDRGVTWSPAQLIHPQGGSAHLAVGPKGELAVRITPASASGNKIEPGVELVAVSTDGGNTWEKHSVPGQRIWAFTEGSTPRWIEPLAWDAKGNLYLLWTQVTGVWLARSVDRGSTWTTWPVQESEGDTLMYYPYLVARGPGELAATWFSGSGESLRWQACKIRVADSATPPQITNSGRFTQDTWRPDDAPSTKLVRTPAGEYLPVLFLSDGGLAVVSPIQNQETNRFGFSFWEFKEPSQGAGKQGTQNPEAYALYLKGRSYWAKRTRADLETAVSYFNQAIAKDPGYAMAYAGLADCYAMLPDYGASVEDIPKAKAAAFKAIELDPTLSRPHVNLGGMKMAHEWDFAGGEAEFKKALELDPNDSHAHQRYADNLGLLGGRAQDALADINRAHQLDPLSLAISVDVGNVYTYARRFDEAIVVCQKVASENLTFSGAHDCLANAYWGKKMYPQVIEEWKAYAKLTGERSDSDYAVALEQGFRSGGWKGALSRSIETMKAQSKTGNSAPYSIAEAYADLGDKEQSFRWLNAAFQEHDIGLMGLNTDFLLDSIRSDPRFAELIHKVGLPQVSKQGTQNPEAYELYLKGRSYWSKRTLSDLETAVFYFNQAIAKDPGYALSYTALADTYAVMPDYGGSPSEDVPKANAAAHKALELDATLGRPHAVLGYIKFVHEWDFAGGEAEFKKALVLDPNDATAHAWYAENIGTIGGREQEALTEINRAHQLDPQSAVISRDLGTNLILARQYDAAIAVCEKVANENPTFAMAHECLGNAYWGKKRYPKVIEEWTAYGKLSGDPSSSESAIAMEQGFRSAGWEGALRRGIETSLAQRKTGNSSAYEIAELYADRGDKDQAFQWLDTAFQEHDQLLIGLKTDFTFEPLRSDPRFAELVRKVGLPQ